MLLMLAWACHLMLPMLAWACRLHMSQHGCLSLSGKEFICWIKCLLPSKPLLSHAVMTLQTLVYNGSSSEKQAQTWQLSVSLFALGERDRNRISLLCLFV